MEIRSTAPGKIILLGEHFVVHGSHALSMAIDKFVEAVATPSDKLSIMLKTYKGRKIFLDDDEKSSIVSFFHILIRDFSLPYMKIDIKLGFPLSAGLGSSASIGFILTEIAYRYRYKTNPPLKKYMEYAGIMEKIVHGNPSGVDHHTVIYGGIILYKKDVGVVDRLLDNSLKLLVVDSGGRRDTGVLVSRVLEIRELLGKPYFSKMIMDVDSLVLRGFKLLSNHNLEEFGRIMNMNQRYLDDIGVSTLNLDYIIDNLNECKAYGSKLTGAGGGGCIISLIPNENESCATDFLDENGFDYFFVKPFYHNPYSSKA